MCKHAKRWGIVIALAMAFSVGLFGTARADEAREEAILEAFEQAVTLYQSGEYDQAKASFEKVLALEPGMQAALKMREMVEVRQLIEMRDNERLRADAEKILDLMRRAVRQRQRTIVEPARLVEDLQSPDLGVYGKARVELIGHGPYAVPYVVHLLALEEAAEQGLVGRTVSLLAAMQRDACLPLICALQGTDSALLKGRVAGLLGQIGDARAVPALMALCEQDDQSLQPARQAAARALESITGQSPTELGSAAAQYVHLSTVYFNEDRAAVGYTYGLSADVWLWHAAGAELADKVTYEEVPAYLYYQRMATQTALDGLATDPANADLQVLLAASLVRQSARCEFFKSADIRLGGEEPAEEVRQGAADRAAGFAVEVPVVLGLLEAPVLARALGMTLEAGDGPAALCLVKALGGKLDAAGPAPPDAETTGALISALASGDKDVRYNAAVVLVQACPTGECGATGCIMQVMSAALKAAAARNALVVIDNFQARNTLVTVLRGEGVATTETEVDEGRIGYALSLEPSVDIVFLSGNAPDDRFAKVMELLSSDPRTKAAPLYVVVDPLEESAELSEYAGIAEVLSPDDLRSAKLAPILQEKVLAESRSAFTEQEEALVLQAAQALACVAALHTEYPLQVLEPSLIAALSGYSEEVTAAAIAPLAAFGSEASVEPLSQIVSGDASVEVKVCACGAMAAVLKRTQAGASEEVVAVLKNALAGDVQALREAAAEVLSAAGLSADEVLLLLCTEGLGEQ